ncbi:hypothetical protein HY469_03805 [Candidatus Roizmanbacteria bacterium]|nr:hypothetical protein [Candidatus Roizmanbacteria bacterium]
MENNNKLLNELKKARQSEIPDSLHRRFTEDILPTFSMTEQKQLIVLPVTQFALVALMLFLIIGSTMAVAARESKPGEFLYPVKSFMERVAPQPIKPLIQSPVQPSTTPTPTPEPTQITTHESEEDEGSDDEQPNNIASPTAILKSSKEDELLDIPEREIDRLHNSKSDVLENVLSDTINRSDEHCNEQSDQVEKDDDDEKDKKNENSEDNENTPSQILKLPVSIDIPPVQIHL